MVELEGGEAFSLKVLKIVKGFFAFGGHFVVLQKEKLNGVMRLTIELYIALARKAKKNKYILCQRVKENKIYFVVIVVIVAKSWVC